MTADQFGTRRHIDPVHVGEAHAGRRTRHIHLLRAGFARHSNDLRHRRTAHDGIVNEEDVFILKFHRHGVQLLTHALFTGLLPRHDEGTAHVAVLDEPFAVGNSQFLRQLLRRGTRRIRNRHHAVDFGKIQLLGDFVGEVFPETQPRPVNADAVDHAVGTGKIDVFKRARR